MEDVPCVGDVGEPPHPSLIRCEIWGMCNICERNFTCWRTVTLDIHVCSTECYQEAEQLYSAHELGRVT